MYFNPRKICLIVGILTSTIVSKNYFLNDEPYFSNVETINYKFTQEKSRYYIDSQCISADELLRDDIYLNLEENISDIAKNCYIENKELKKHIKKGNTHQCVINSDECKKNCSGESFNCISKCHNEELLCFGKNRDKENFVWDIKRTGCLHKDNFKEFLPYLKSLKQKYSYSMNNEELSPRIKQLSDEYINNLISNYYTLEELRNLKQPPGKIIICKSNFSGGNYPWYWERSFFNPSNMDNKRNDFDEKTRVTIINYNSDYIKSVRVNSQSTVVTLTNKFMLLNHFPILKNTRIYFEKYSQKNQYGIYNYFIKNLIYYFIALYFLLSFWLYGLLISPLVFLFKGLYKKISNFFIFLIKIISIFWEWLRK